MKPATSVWQMCDVLDCKVPDYRPTYRHWLNLGEESVRVVARSLLALQLEEKLKLG